MEGTTSRLPSRGEPAHTTGMRHLGAAPHCVRASASVFPSAIEAAVASRSRIVISSQIRAR